MAVIINGDSVITSPLSVGFGGGNDIYSVAMGLSALASNTTGLYNTAVGQSSLNKIGRAHV